jgi:hypothetical protein
MPVLSLQEEGVKMVFAHLLVGLLQGTHVLLQLAKHVKGPPQSRLHFNWPEDHRRQCLLATQKEGPGVQGMRRTGPGRTTTVKARRITQPGGNDPESAFNSDSLAVSRGT